MLEQASARVTVQAPKLVAICDRDLAADKTRLAEVTCEAELTENLPYRITERSALADTIPIMDSPLNILVPAGEQNYWYGPRGFNTTAVIFKGTVVVVGNRTIALTSNPASFAVVPRVWQPPVFPAVAPVVIVTKAQADSALNRKDPNYPKPYPELSSRRQQVYQTKSCKAASRSSISAR